VTAGAPAEAGSAAASMLHRVPHSIRSFLAVGAVGFLIDAGLLAALTHGAGWSPWAARVPSFTAAVLTTWLLNRRLTFPGRGLQRRSTEALGYGAIQACGAGINLLVFGLCLAVVPRLAATPVIPFAVGAAVAMMFNYLALKLLVYAQPRPEQS
jgi:putative flippase GtrA